MKEKYTQAERKAYYIGLGCSVKKPNVLLMSLTEKEKTSFANGFVQNSIFVGELSKSEKEVVKHSSKKNEVRIIK